MEKTKTDEDLVVWNINSADGKNKLITITDVSIKIPNYKHEEGHVQEYLSEMTFEGSERSKITIQMGIGFKRAIIKSLLEKGIFDLQGNMNLENIDEYVNDDLNYADKFEEAIRIKEIKANVLADEAHVRKMKSLAKRNVNGKLIIEEENIFMKGPIGTVEIASYKIDSDNKKGKSFRIFVNDKSIAGGIYQKDGNRLNLTNFINDERIEKFPRKLEGEWLRVAVQYLMLHGYL
jgi:hypothetical protein